jgi:dienelactone hydrolase
VHLLLLRLILWVGASSLVMAQSDLSSIVALFRAADVQVDGQSYPYRLLEPLPLQRTQQRPLLVFFHGAGERGDDNVSQLKWLPELMVRDERRQQFPCFLLAVQCPKTEQWVDVPWGESKPRVTPLQPSRAMRAVQQALAEVVQNPGVDPARIYVTGLSMGGYGTWDLVARQGHMFAGAVPVCGGGDPLVVRQSLGMPIEIWHAANDRVVPVQRARLMAEQYRLLGVSARYFEDPDAGHAVWQQAYADGHAIDWLFAQDQRQQRRGQWSGIAIIPRPDQVARRDGTFAIRVGSRCVVPVELRGLASYFLDQLSVEAVRRPGLVTGVQPVAGDIVLRLDPAMTSGYELDVGDFVSVTASNARGMRNALAALFELLSSLPGPMAPQGTFADSRAALETTLCLERPIRKWQFGPMGALLREAWLGSVDTICFRGGGQAQSELRAYREFAVLATRLGMEIKTVWPETVLQEGRAAMATSGDAVAKVLSGVRGAAKVIVMVRSDKPPRMLLQARQLLAATAEGTMRGASPVHVGAFLARLGARYR